MTTIEAPKHPDVIYEVNVYCHSYRKSEPGELRINKSAYMVTNVTEKNYVTTPRGGAGRHLIALDRLNVAPSGVSLNHGVNFSAYFTCTVDMIDNYVALVKQYYKMELLELHKSVLATLEALEGEEPEVPNER